MSPRMKSNLELVQELLENRLDNLNEKIDTNNNTLAEKIDVNNKHVLELLNFIREQTTKTNGRVTKLESNEIQHFRDCPRVKEIETIHSEIATLQREGFILQIWNKYPKQATLAFAVTFAIFIGSIGFGIFQVHQAIKGIKANTVLIEENK